MPVSLPPERNYQRPQGTANRFDTAWLLHKNIPGREQIIGHIF